MNFLVGRLIFVLSLGFTHSSALSEKDGCKSNYCSLEIRMIGIVPTVDSQYKEPPI